MSEIKNKDDDPEPDKNNFSDECIFNSCDSCDGINHFDGWELVCECPCHTHKTEFQKIDKVPMYPAVNQEKKEEIPIPLKAICLKESRTETDLTSLYAKINETGDLVLEGQDIGETPQKYWGRDEYEYWLTVDKKYKDSILLLLIKDRFTSDSKFKQWLEEKGIPSEFHNWV